MSFGIANTPGAWFVTLKNQLKEMVARIGSVEKTLSGSEKIPGTSAPTAQVAAKVGQIYINVTTGEEWKCTAVNGSSTTWEKLTKTGVALTATDIGAVPVTRKVNNKALSTDISLTASDVGARPSTWTPTAADVGAVPTTRKVNSKALSADISLTAADVGAAATSHGTHVTYSTTAPVMDGTASAGSAATVARSDHKHPTDTSRAAANHTHTASDVGASATGHKHTKSEITDFPSSMPASDVSAWAKAATKPTYTASEVGAAATSHGTHVTYSTTAPVMDGTASAGSAATVARSDHKHPTDTSRAAANHTHTASDVGAKASSWKPFYAGTSAPSDKTQLWIDTTASDPKLKYHNGSAWVAVPVGFFVP